MIAPVKRKLLFILDRIFCLLTHNGWHNLQIRPGTTFHLAVRKPINAGIGAAFANFAIDLFKSLLTQKA